MKLKKSSIRLTPTNAKAFRERNTYPGQRGMGPAYLEELERKMRAGDFHEGLIAIIRLSSGEEVLANGQHQCTAVIETGISVDARLHEWTVEPGDSPADIARVFAQYNVDKNRSRGDIAWIYGAQANMGAWPPRCVKLCNTALGWIYTRLLRKGKLSKDDNALLLLKHKQECAFVYETAFVNGANAKHLYRSPVVAAMMETSNKDLEHAYLFWGAVRDGDMLKTADPAYKCREMLKAIRVRTVSIGNPTMDERELYARCIHFWNGSRGKGGCSGRYYPDAPLPTPK